MVKWISGTLLAVGAFVIGCSESTTEPQFLEIKSVNQKNDATNIWARIDESGSIANYFDSLSKEGNAPAIGTATHSKAQCKAPALQMDDNTRYLDELESLFEEGELVEGVCGKALKLNDGQVAPLGVNLIDSMNVGTAEFWFRPNEDFYEKPRTLFGNDGARLHFFYKDGELYFQKNHHNLHYYARGKVTFKNDWNLIAGQWGDGYMSIWVNGEMVALLKHDLGYVPATRDIDFENLLKIGYKSACCMPLGNSAMYTSGAYDQIRISTSPRYKVEVKEEQEEAAKDSTVGVEINPVIPIIDTVITVDTVFVEKKPVVDTTIYVKPYVEKIDTTWIPVVKKCCNISDDLIIKEPIELDITDSL